MYRTLAATAASLCLLAGPAHAQIQAPDIVGVHLASAHSNKAQDWNNTNPGVYARWGSGLTLGVYENSIRNTSVYAGWGADRALSERVAVGVTLGLVSGYTRPIEPLVVPNVKFAITKEVAARLHLIVNPRPGGAHALHFTVEFKIGE